MGGFRIIKIKKIIDTLKLMYPDAHCELNYQTPFQLLIATILSAQCTDIMVNRVTEKLFAQYPDAPSLSTASIEEIENLIKSIGLFKNKARFLSLSSKMLVDEFGGQVPSKMEELIRMPGVGRKTANVVLSNAFDIHQGVVVDTHVRRITFRLGLTKHKDVDKIEEDLMKIVPQKLWGMFSHWIIFLGRRQCFARNPNCETCALNNSCAKII